MKNLRFYMKNNNDHYGLLADKDFYELMAGTISVQPLMRPNVAEILNSNFMQSGASDTMHDVKSSV